MIIVLGGIKGGSGKSMLATNLTVMRAMAGKRVLLIDADEQHTSSDWAAHRIESDLKLADNWSTAKISGKTLHAQIQKLMTDYDDVIIDVGGRDTTSQRSALSIADIMIVPVRPRSPDIWTFDDLQNMVSQIGAHNHKLKCMSILNQADHSGSDNEEALKVMAEYPEIICLDQIIGMRKGFANAMTKGLSVLELKIPDQKAIQEIRNLYSCIYD